jgi:hypothetical protein
MISNLSVGDVIQPSEPDWLGRKKAVLILDLVEYVILEKVWVVHAFNLTEVRKTMYVIRCPQWQCLVSLTESSSSVSSAVP